MALLGTIINGVCIIVGSLFGLFFTKIPDRFKDTVLHGISLTVILIGMKMAFSSELIIIVLLGLLTGAIIGEWLQIEERLNHFGDLIGKRFASSGENTKMSQGFVTATLIFVVGAMAIIGALDSGVRGDHEVLITKGILDGFMSLVLSTTFGIGVLFSVIPVVLYQGTIALLATRIESLIPDEILNGFIVELTAVGGLIIVAIGLNILNLTKIKIGNLLPSLGTVAVIYYVYFII